MSYYFLNVLSSFIIHLILIVKHVAINLSWSRDGNSILELVLLIQCFLLTVAAFTLTSLVMLWIDESLTDLVVIQVLSEFVLLIKNYIVEDELAIEAFNGVGEIVMAGVFRLEA